MEQIMSMIPGLAQAQGMKGMQPDEGELKRWRLYQLHDAGERNDHNLINAAGGGALPRERHTVQDVNRC